MLDVRENKIKKLKMRSMRRGIKEMDVILSYYSEVCLEKMSGVKLDLYSDMSSNTNTVRNAIHGPCFGWIDR